MMVANGSDMKDVFLCHTGGDKPWVEALAERLERVAEVNAGVDAEFGRRTAVGQATEGRKRLFQVGNSLAIGAPYHSAKSCLAEIDDRLVPLLPSHSMVSQLLRLLDGTPGGESLNRFSDSSVQSPSAVVE